MTLIAGVVLALAFISCSLWGQTQAKKEMHRNTRTITGCVQKHGDDYQLMTAKDGDVWNVKSDNVHIAEYVGQTVTVTGVISNPALHGVKEDAKEKVEKNPTEHGRMTVTNLKMVSESCEK